MELLSQYGKDDLAIVSVIKYDNDLNKLVECVESVQPPIPWQEKWVLIISVLFGCPVKCPICDAGKRYCGKLSTGQILDQIEYLVNKKFKSNIIPIPKFKIQFARMGEPSFNQSVLEVLKILPMRYNAPGLMPCISTIAPHKCLSFFDELKDIKSSLYSDGHFQLQFSIHSTDNQKRHEIIPFPIWNFEQISNYGDSFYEKNDRKITLNFVCIDGYEISSKVVSNYFSPSRYLIKLTPLNPTESVKNSSLKSKFSSPDSEFIKDIMAEFHSLGYETVLNIGESEENEIGSNCGQFVSQLEKESIIRTNYSSSSYMIK